MSPVNIKSILYSPVYSLKGSIDSTMDGEMTFNVAANDAGTFCKWASGQTYSVTVGGIATTRIIPLSHPDYPSLLCKNFDCKLTGSYTPGNSQAMQNWSDAKVTLTFKSVPYATDGQTPYMVRRGRSSGEEYSLAGRQLVFAGNGQPIQADASLKVATQAFSVTLYQATKYDDALVSGLAGSVNSTTCLNYAPGYLRYDSAEYEQTQSLSGTTFTITYYFTWRSIPWNKFLRPDCVWDTVAIGTSGGTAFGYNSADLNQLLA